MKLSLKTLLVTNYNLKVLSLLFGYFVWFMFSQSATVQATFTVPVCFYNNTRTISSAPEKVQITLQAKRSDLYRCDIDSLAVHINGASLCAGTNTIVVNESTLFLPESIKVVHCIPYSLEVRL